MALHAEKRGSLVREPDAGNLPVRFDEAGCGNGAMVEPLRHRQTKGAANRYVLPNATRATFSTLRAPCKGRRFSSGMASPTRQSLQPEANRSSHGGNEVAEAFD